DARSLSRPAEPVPAGSGARSWGRRLAQSRSRLRGSMKPIVDLFCEFAEQAVREFGLEERLFSIGGCHVRLRFAGGRWTTLLTKAFHHLETQKESLPQSDENKLTISILDGSMVPRNPLLRFYLKPLVDFWPEYTGPRGELHQLHGGSVMAFYKPG